MPDNAPVGATTVAADELRTVNGVDQVEPLPKAQRIKIGHGIDGVFDDASAATPLPVDAASVVAQLQAILTELQTKLEAGQAVTLDPAALAALENVTVGGTVALDATTLTALETISIAQGAFAYAAGVAPATVDVPAGGRVKRVSVIAGAGGTATVTIAGGATITIPAGGSFDEQVPGDVAAGADVVIGGTVASYYVGWVV